VRYRRILDYRHYIAGTVSPLLESPACRSPPAPFQNWFPRWSRVVSTLLGADAIGVAAVLHQQHPRAPWTDQVKRQIRNPRMISAQPTSTCAIRARRSRKYE
jgi:hypothetical protein